ncbi:Cytochrome P450 [Aliiroseovarius crassostreae]|uniref:Cytochrome n=1 Tax=Aliiroseovarius crassostreae TaxID=154981 RepID=A0A0P7IDV3_9RHOB|nr:cytochrome P450 [Aliiroseovarius crassostreae]KPN62236.1 cytochrome [Aliiroseovarius crassostreae]SFU52818.1 Cytochrome P450 [Aliiroseovarius crassostreae]
MSCPHLPPKPPARSGRVSLRRYAKLFRQDILSAQPARLYRAWMAEFRTPFFRSFMCNDPKLIDLVLKGRPDDFPKSDRIREGLAPLLGNSVFITNGETWKRQRRIIDPAFEGGRVREVFPAMWDAGVAAVTRLAPLANGQPVEIELQTSHAAADVIFRTLFSIPIEHEVAGAVFDRFKDHQRAQPVVNLGAILPLPKWFPRFHSRQTRETARDIRALITRLTEERMSRIEAGTAPDDLATKIMTTQDPETGQRFDTEEMVDQVAIFFLAGHETSASALAWSLYLLALYPEWQERVAREALTAIDPEKIYFSVMSKLKLSRDVFREAMRLYPPVPMMVREAACPEQFRGRNVPRGSQIVLSPWHAHRHERIWDRPDEFDPARFSTPDGKESMRAAYYPFSAGQRVCPGSAFAMIEGALILSLLVRAYHFEIVKEKPAMPVAHLTVRGKDGIWLKLVPRAVS